MKIRFLFLALLYTNIIFAQKNFRDGFIILKDSKDTIKGKIDDKNWLSNPISINFKSNINNNTDFNIVDLKAFGIYNKEYYEVKTVDLDITPFQTGSLLTNPQRIIKKDTLIALMVLLKAEHQLSFFSDRLGKEHFFYQNFESVIELVNHKFLQNTRNGIYEVQNKLFQKQLDTLYSRCSKKLKTSTLNYNSKDLVNSLTDFNDCMGCTSVCYIKNEVDKNQIYIHILTSLERNSFTQNVLENGNLVLNEKSKSSILGFGLASTISSRRSKGSNNLYSEIFFSKRAIENKFYEANFTSLTWSNIYRKNILNYPKFKPFLGFGLGLNFLFSDGIKLTPLTAPNGEWNFLDFAKLAFDGVVESGINVKKFHIFYRFKVKLLNPPAYHTLLLHFNTINYDRIASQFGVSYQFIKSKHIE